MMTEAYRNTRMMKTLTETVRRTEMATRRTGNMMTRAIYYIDDVHYVAVDDVTGKVIQVADLNKADWVFDLTK